MEKNTIVKQVLSPEQNKLIVDLFPKVKNILKNKYLKTFKRGTRKDNKIGFGSVQEALSFIPEVILEFKQKEVYDDKFNLAEWTAQRCHFRLLDQCRDLNNLEILAEKRYLDEDHPYHSNYLSRFLNDIFNRKNQQKNKTYFSDVDWNDLETNIGGQIDEFFISRGMGHETVGPLSVEKTKVYRLILKEWLLPKVTQKKYKTLKQIGQDLLISETRVSQLVNSDDMKNLIKFCLDVTI